VNTCTAAAVVVVGWLPACPDHQQAAADAVEATGHSATPIPVSAMPCRAGRLYPTGGQR